jgi:hypothetical protein
MAGKTRVRNATLSLSICSTALRGVSPAECA